MDAPLTLVPRLPPPTVVDIEVAAGIECVSALVGPPTASHMSS